MKEMEILVKEVKELDEVTDAALIRQLLVIVRNHKSVNSAKELKRAV